MFSPKYLFSLANRTARIINHKNNQIKSFSCGSIIECLERRILLSTTYNLSTLVDFNGTNGNYISSGLIANSSGDLFGTTAYGDVGFNGSSTNPGYGTVFELAKTGTNYTLSTLVGFDGPNGYDPFCIGGLVMDSSGDLYGTTTENLNEFGGVFGTVFEVVKSSGGYTLSTLVQFTGISQGNDPECGLVMDRSGDLFGTTQSGLTSEGTIFELAKTGGGFTFSTLVSFDNTDGKGPDNLVMDSQGDLFGSCPAAGGKHVIFEAEKDGGSYTLVDLASFAAEASPLAVDPSGNLYGSYNALGTDGSIFEMVKSGGGYIQENLANFNGTNGNGPQGSLTLDGSGNLFGGTGNGGSLGYGTVFEIAAGSGTITTLANLQESGSGSQLLLDSEGNLYGTAPGNLGNPGYGDVFKLSPILHLAFATQPTTTVAGGIVNQLVVDVEDAGNHIFVDYDSTVSLTATPAPGNIGGTRTVTAINGVAIFKQCFEFTTSGNYQLQPTDASGDPGSLSNSFTITPAAASLLVFAAGPTNTTSGKIYNPPIVVYVMDVFRNIVRNVNTAVTLSVHSGPSGGTVHGTATVNLNNGAAIFSNVWLVTTGSYTLTAKDGSLTPIISPTFTVGAAPGVAVGGNAGAMPLLAMPPQPEGSLLAGILMGNVARSAGIFSDLAVNLAGTYLLQASDGFGIAVATSGSIAVS